MSKYRVQVTQTFRTERSITFEVEAETLEEAIENVESGAEDVPSFDDPRWMTGWDLRDEEVREAP